MKGREKLSARQIDIIKVLKNNTYIKGETIASFVGASLRTVQKEMSYLKKMELVNSGKNGYYLTNSNEILNLYQNDEKNIIQTLLQMLLSTNTPIDVDELADNLFVSTSTLRNRLKDVNKIISTENLSLKSHKNTICIDGNELNKRRMFRRMIYLDLPSDIVNVDAMSTYFNGIDIKRLYDIIIDSIESFGFFVQDAYLSNLMLNLCIALYRIAKGMHTDDYQVEQSTKTIEYRLAREICIRFSVHYGCNINSGDIAYIASFLRGQIIPTDREGDKNIYDEEFENKVKKILNDVFEKYMLTIDFYPQIHNIYLHIFELVKRAKNQNYASNSIQNSIKQSCPFIYDVAVYFAHLIELEFNVKVPDEEIAFLSVHIGFLIENSIQSTSKIDILLCASNYHGLANSIKSSIEKRYKDEINIIAIDPEINEMPKHSIDFVISTSPIEIIGKPVINISPFLNNIDRTNIDVEINRCLKSKESRTLREFLMSCFNQNLFFKTSDIKNINNAINFLGNKMVEFGVADENFISSVFEREKLSPTCFFNSFAIPHAINMNAHKTMVGVLINEEGIDWGTCNIKLCLMIAVKKNGISEFSRVYNILVQSLCNPETYTKLIKCDQSIDFKNILLEQK